MLSNNILQLKVKKDKNLNLILDEEGIKLLKQFFLYENSSFNLKSSVIPIIFCYSFPTSLDSILYIDFSLLYLPYLLSTLDTYLLISHLIELIASYEGYIGSLLFNSPHNPNNNTDDNDKIQFQYQLTDCTVTNKCIKFRNPLISQQHYGIDIDILIQTICLINQIIFSN